MDDKCVYLDTYVLQQDMRIRLPKAILSNMGVEKGITKFDIFWETHTNSIVMKIHVNTNKSKEIES